MIIYPVAAASGGGKPKLPAEKSETSPLLLARFDHIACCIGGRVVEWEGEQDDAEAELP